jgi:TP901 family phage tail tape measure protein
MAMNIDTVLRIVAKVSGTENLNKLEKGIMGAEKAAKDARSAFTSVTSSATWQAAAVGAAALGAGLAVSVRTGVEFEKAMSGVAAKVGGTSEEIGKLNELAQDLGRKTQFSAKEAAEGMDFLAMAGFKTNEIVAAMPGLLDLAAAGQLELGQAADIASNILGGLGMKAEETGRVADVLAKAATSSNVSVEMLGETFKVVAPVAAQAGVSLEELAAAAGVLGDAGIQGSEAGTGLRSVLLRLAAPPKEAADALDRLGIATKDSAGNMRPFGDILSDVDRRMKELNLGTGDQLEIQNALYGKTAIASGAILQQAAASGTLTEKLKELIEAQGFGAKTAETMNDNVAGAFKRLQSAIEGFQIALTSGANPALQGVIDGLAGLINVVTDVMKQFPLLSTAVLALSAAFIGLVAVAPFIAAFISIIGSLKAALAVGSIGAAWAGIQTVIIVAVAGMKTALVGFLSWVATTMVPGLLAALGPAGWTVLAVAAVVAAAIAFREPITKFLQWLYQSFTNAWVSLGNNIRGIWTGIIASISNAFNSFLQNIRNGINAISNQVNRLIRSINQLGGPQLPQIPQFAQGGFVRRPTMAVIGEGGEPEYVVPQSKSISFANNIVAGRRGEAAISTAAAGRSSTRIVSAAPSFRTTSGSTTAPSTATTTTPTGPITINIETGPVMELNGQRYVTYEDMERAMRATAEGVIGRMRTPQARIALGRH